MNTQIPDGTILKEIEQLLSQSDAPAHRNFLKTRETVLKKKESKKQSLEEQIRTMDLIKKEIETNFHQKIPSMESVATRLKMPLQNFKVFFKEHYGKPYYSYFLDDKLERGRLLLLTGEFSVKEVAEILGYTSPIKFILPFKKRFLTTPYTFKKIGKEKTKEID